MMQLLQGAVDVRVGLVCSMSDAFTKAATETLQAATTDQEPKIPANTQASFLVETLIKLGAVQVRLAALETLRCFSSRAIAAHHSSAPQLLPCDRVSARVMSPSHVSEPDSLSCLRSCQLTAERLLGAACAGMA